MYEQSQLVTVKGFGIGSIVARTIEGYIVKVWFHGEQRNLYFLDSQLSPVCSDDTSVFSFYSC